TQGLAILMRCFANACVSRTIPWSGMVLAPSIIFHPAEFEGSIGLNGSPFCRRLSHVSETNVCRRKQPDRFGGGAGPRSSADSHRPELHAPQVTSGCHRPGPVAKRSPD